MNKYLHTVISFLNQNKSVVITLILVGIVADILFIGLKSDLITFSIIGLVIVFFRFYKMSSKKIFVLCFVPIGIIFFGFLIDPASIQIEKASIWLFLLIGAGIVQELITKGKQ